MSRSRTGSTTHSASRSLRPSSRKASRKRLSSSRPTIFARSLPRALNSFASGLKSTPSASVTAQTLLAKQTDNPYSSDRLRQIRCFGWKLVEFFREVQVVVHWPGRSAKDPEYERMVLRCTRSSELVDHIFPIRVAKELANPPRHRGALGVRRATGSRHHKTNFTCAPQ